MAGMTGAERVLTAIRRGVPDMVPTLEMDIHIKVIDAIRPGLDYVGLCEHLDLDAVVYNDQKTVRWETIDSGQGLARSEWGNVSQFTGVSENSGILREPAITTLKDLDAYSPPDPDDPKRYEPIAEGVRRFKGEKAIIATVLDPFHRVSTYMRGHEVFREMKRSPELVERMLELARDFAVRYTRNCIEVGVDAVWNAGDWAVTQGPMASRKMTARFMIPGLKAVVDCCHDRGLPCLHHTDGNVWPILDLIVDTGLDALNPIDPIAGMDLAEVKAKYGDTVCLMGNVDCGELLCWGSREEVREKVRECIAKAGPGGGYICMSSNTIHGTVNPENYVEMVRAIREHGRYPLLS